MPCADSPTSATRLLQHWAVTQPVTVALRFDYRSWTWTELLDRVRRLAGALREAGISPGDRIAFRGRNHPAALELGLAGAWIGAVTVVVNYRLAPAEIDYVVRDAEAAIVVVRPEDDHGAPSYAPDRPRTYVYRRAGEACRVCGTPIRTEVMEARNRFWCPTCQT